MIKVGLTGGIGSGKSTIAKVFRQLGIPIYEADIEARKLMETSSTIINALKARYGEDIYTDNKLNRVKLAEIIFNNNDELKHVNQIVHPVVREDFLQWSECQDADYVIEEAAILFESGSHSIMDLTIAVTAPENIRIERVMKRDNIDAKQVKARINNQLPEETKVAWSDFVINNDNEQLIIPQVVEIDKKIKEHGEIR
ncbi:dephospho-CoA kinase [Prolixibacteraceae bacterium JC049]|nr:dephospho-CoA kinase [Prolixibacteraceae bacterium JC049]